jgi:hypothetical protein
MKVAWYYFVKFLEKQSQQPQGNAQNSAQNAEYEDEAEAQAKRLYNTLKTNATIYNKLVYVISKNCQKAQRGQLPTQEEIENQYHIKLLNNK